VLLLKVCGITRGEDAAAACGMGYGAIGLVFAESPRRISPDRAREICSGVSPSVLRIGVFAGEESGEVKRIMDYCRLDLVQFHGGEDPGEVLRFGGRAIAALRPRSPEDLRRIADYHGIFAVLIDTWDPLLAGGTGRTCDWGLASRAAAGNRVILAGGLTPDNVGEAVKRVRPFGVDVCSGVESAPGKKDGALMREFARAARDAASGVTEEGSKGENTGGD
jgi:phosphoribosylanthranilate isomerase